MKAVVNNVGALLLLLFAHHLNVKGDHTKILRKKDGLEWLVNIEDGNGIFFCSGKVFLVLVNYQNKNCFKYLNLNMLLAQFESLSKQSYS